MTTQSGRRAQVTSLAGRSETQPDGRVLVISPDASRRRAFGEALEAAGFSTLAIASVSEEPAGEIALLFVDLALKDIDAIDFVRRVSRRDPPMPVVAIGERGDDERIIAAIRAGAHGCIYADDGRERLAAAASEALAGGRPMSRGMAPLLLEHIRRTGRRSASAERSAVRPLTERERVVLCQMATGQSYEDIGRALGVSLNTVRTYVRSVYEKLDVNSRTEAVLLGTKLGIVTGAPYPTPKPRR
jgi:DNA-binding NarL/FixJ family response regulator